MKLPTRSTLVAAIIGITSSCSARVIDPAAGKAPAPTGPDTSFAIQIWADNWMAVYVNGEKIGEDSVPIATERSFNAETFAFTATYPFTLGIEARDYMASESGLEYIGQPNQQRGDGGSTPEFDASGWTSATTWSVSAVSPREGYYEIPWNPSAALIWGTDLKVDNIVLFRQVISG